MSLSATSEGDDSCPGPDGVTVLGVQFASIRSLFAPLRERSALMLVHVNDWLNVARCMVNPGAFVQMQRPAGLDWQEWRFPPGWAGRFAPWVMPILAKRVEQGWRRRGWKNPRLVVTFPYFLPAVRQLGGGRAIYYAVDNYQAYWPDRAAAVREQENALIRDAAATVAASSALSDWFRSRVPQAAGKIHYVPNDIRPDMTVPPRARGGDMMRYLGAKDGPVIGCYGNIASGYGIEFLVAVVEKLLDFKFLLMGQVVADGDATYRQAIAALESKPNVVMTGRLEEPGSVNVLHRCDVMVLPLPLTEQVRFSCPNRLWTYMATGKPIVSTPIPEVTKFGDLVYAAGDVDGFVEAVRRAAHENDPERARKRMQVAAEHTWPVLAQRMWSVVSATV